MSGLIDILNEHYPIRINCIELIRDMGSIAYLVLAGSDKLFLRVIKPAFFNTAIIGADIQVFLQNKNFPVPQIIFTNENMPYVQKDDKLLILYEFIEGDNSNPEQDAEAIGELVGKLHYEMKAYPRELVSRDKHFYIGRYIEILQIKKYPRKDEYVVHGDALWGKIKDLPRGYCHGDMYDGNIRKSFDGKLYIHDFDTSCEGFPMYDPTLICNMTEYFNFDERNYERSNAVLSRFIPEYRKYNVLRQIEINCFHALIAIQHFSTQATVMEIFGLDRIDDIVMDSQLDWLYKWQKQCMDMCCYKS